MNWFEWLDDKTQVIIAVTFLGVLLMVTMPDVASDHFDAIVSGLFGVAIGKAVKAR